MQYIYSINIFSVSKNNIINATLQTRKLKHKEEKQCIREDPGGPAQVMQLEAIGAASAPLTNIALPEKLTLHLGLD